VNINDDLLPYRYVLLKERNMIMTMEEEYKRQAELFPSPERLEKVILLCQQTNDGWLVFNVPFQHK